MTHTLHASFSSRRSSLDRPFHTSFLHNVESIELYNISPGVIVPLSSVLLSLIASAAAVPAIPAVEPKDLGAVSLLDTRATAAAKYRIDFNKQVDSNYTTGKRHQSGRLALNTMSLPLNYLLPAKDDGCQPFHQEIIGLSRHFTLVREGGLSYETKLKHVLERYSNYLMVYGDENEGLHLSGTGINAAVKVSASLGKS